MITSAVSEGAEWVLNSYLGALIWIVLPPTWQENTNGGSFPLKTLYLDVSTLGGHYLVGDTEAQSGPRSNRFGGEKGIKDLVLVLRRNACSLICHLDAVIFALKTGRHLNRLAWNTRLDRIGQNIADCLIEGARHTEQLRQVGKFRRHAYPVLVQQRVQKSERCLYAFCQVARFSLSLVQPRKIAKIENNFFHPLEALDIGCNLARQGLCQIFKVNFSRLGEDICVEARRESFDLW